MQGDELRQCRLLPYREFLARDPSGRFLLSWDALLIHSWQKKLNYQESCSSTHRLPQVESACPAWSTAQRGKWFFGKRKATERGRLQGWLGNKGRKDQPSELVFSSLDWHQWSRWPFPIIALSVFPVLLFPLNLCKNTSVRVSATSEAININSNQGIDHLIICIWLCLLICMSFWVEERVGTWGGI